MVVEIGDFHLYRCNKHGAGHAYCYNKHGAGRAVMGVKSNGC